MVTEVGPRVGIVMGSDSDWPVSDAAQTLTDFGVEHEVDVVSAHRMPAEMIRVRLPEAAASRGLRVIIAGGRGGSPSRMLARSRRCL